MFVRSALLQRVINKTRANLSLGRNFAVHLQWHCSIQTQAALHRVELSEQLPSLVYKLPPHIPIGSNWLLHFHSLDFTWKHWQLRPLNPPQALPQSAGADTRCARWEEGEREEEDEDEEEGRGRGGEAEEVSTDSLSGKVWQTEQCLAVTLVTSNPQHLSWALINWFSSRYVSDSTFAPPPFKPDARLANVLLNSGFHSAAICISFRCDLSSSVVTATRRRGRPSLHGRFNGARVRARSYTSPL